MNHLKPKQQRGGSLLCVWTFHRQTPGIILCQVDMLPIHWGKMSKLLFGNVHAFLLLQFLYRLCQFQ